MSTYKASLLDALKRLSGQLSAKFAKKSELPTKVSQLSNDSGYLTSNSFIDESKLQYAPASTSNLPISRFFYGGNRANKLAFLPPDQVVIEKTVDGGKTWQDAELADSVKKNLFSGVIMAGIYLPTIDGKKSALCGIRISFTSMKYNVPEGTAETEKCKYWNKDYIVSPERYCTLDALYLFLSSSSEYITGTVEAQNGNGNWITLADNRMLSGWSGPNIITFSSTTFGGSVNQPINYWNYRITLMTTPGANGFNPSYITQPQNIQILSGYGPITWRASNKLMETDHLYNISANQDATFPASVDAKVLKQGGISLADVYATIAEVNGKVDKVSGKSLSTNDYTTAEKTKLAGIATGANNYTLPTASSSVLGGVKVGSNLTITNGVLAAVQGKVDLSPYAKSTDVSSTYETKAEAATALAAKVDKVANKGLSTNDYTTAEKSKLAGITDGATKVVVDSTFSNTSSNPASSKAIASILDSRHPVGSIIMSITEISPATIYGGTWVAGTLPVIGGIAFDDGTMVSDIFVYKRTG